jgi:5'-nucleotidase
MSERIDPYKTVLVDMDNVLAEFHGAVLDSLPAELSKVAIKNFYIDEDFPTHANHIIDFTSRPEFFHNLHVVEGALEGWQRIIDLGYDPRICSAPLESNPKSIEGKHAWLDRILVPHFGRQVRERAIIDKEKYKYDGLVIIDDRSHMDTNNGQAIWQHVVFDRTYNQDSKAKFRLYGWHDPNLGEILETAERHRHQI